MKLGMQTHTDIVAGAQEEVAISFEANAVAFYAQISGLAKDKIGYPIRELSTNAWDASRGRMDVQLPTSLNPVFRVRDYGPGISAENMRNVYGRLYASTKRSNNEEVGGWGLGSKSPYAYLIGDNGSGSYNVVSYHEGMMRAYVLSLSAEGAPMMRLLAEMPSNEPSGLDVSFSVRREDIREFQDRAFKILWSFNPRPTITPAINWPTPVVLSSGTNWTSYKPSTVPFWGPQVRMGCVMYPFDLRQIKASGFLVDTDAILFEAPIGSLKVTLSREELAYDDKTKATLSSLVEQYENSFISQLREKVEAADSLFSACKAFDEGVESLDQGRQERLRLIISWRGLPITHFIPKHNFKTGMLLKGWQRFDKFEDCNVRTNWATDVKVVIEHNPHYSLGRLEMAGLIGEKVLWVRCKRVDRDETLRRLGNPEVIDLDSFKVPVEKRTSKTIRKRRTLEVRDTGSIYKVTQDVDLADGGYYVEEASHLSRRGRGNEWYRIADGRGSITHYDLQQVLETCVSMQLIEAGTVILIKKYDQEVPDNWTMLGDDIIEGLRAKVDVSEITGLHNKTINHMDRYVRALVHESLFTVAPEDLKEFNRDLRSLHDILSANSTRETVSDKAIAALHKLGVSVDKPNVSCPIQAIKFRYAALCRKYQLLSMIMGGAGYYGGVDPAVKSRIKHYFSLLTRPEIAEADPAAPMSDENEEEIDLDDEDFDLDEAA